MSFNLEFKMKKIKKKSLFLPLFLIILNILGIYTRKYFVLNISSSIPIGIYKVDKSTDFKRGDIVTFSTKRYKAVSYTHLNNFSISSFC